MEYIPRIIARNIHTRQGFQLSYSGAFQCGAVLWIFKELPISLRQIFQNHRTSNSGSLNFFLVVFCRIQEPLGLVLVIFKHLKESTVFTKEPAILWSFLWHFAFLKIMVNMSKLILWILWKSVGKRVVYNQDWWPVNTCSSF